MCDRQQRRRNRKPNRAARVCYTVAPGNRGDSEAAPVIHWKTKMKEKQLVVAVDPRARREREREEGQPRSRSHHAGPVTGKPICRRQQRARHMRDGAAPPRVDRAGSAPDGRDGLRGHRRSPPRPRVIARRSGVLVQPRRRYGTIRGSMVHCPRLNPVTLSHSHFPPARLEGPSRSCCVCNLTVRRLLLLLHRQGQV